VPPATKVEYKYMATYAGTLGNGQPVEPGETVKIDKEVVELSRQMIDDGQLVEVKGGDK
jgi:hypothetical protein